MRRQDDDKVTEIFQAERDSLFRLACYKIGDADTAADILQDLFVKIWNNPAATASITDLRSYLYRSLLNTCISLHRSHQAEFLPLDNNIAEESSDDDFHREYRAIAHVMKHIPEEQKEVIMLRTIGGKSFNDIATILDLPLPTVKSRFRYGIDKIRKMIHATQK